MKILVAVISIVLFMNNSYAAESYSQSKGNSSDSQGMTQRDTDISRAIRERIMADSSLSINAQNIKIFSQDGKVTLRGDVASAAERSKVEGIAKSVAGKMSVINSTIITK